MSDLINIATRREEKQLAKNAFTTVFQFKIKLKQIAVPVWRRIIIPANCTFHELHDILQKIMGWNGKKDHLFHTHNPRTNEEFSIGLKNKTSINHLLPEYTEKISHYLSIKNQYIYYIYDLQHNWEHEIIFEKVYPRNYTVCYPLCIEGKNATPPEICNGPAEYNTFLRIVGQPGNEKYAEIKTLLGETFDPYSFNCVNSSCNPLSVLTV